MGLFTGKKGLVLGVAVMVAILGFFVWRERGQPGGTRVREGPAVVAPGSS